MFCDDYLQLAWHWLDRFADPKGEKRRSQALAADAARKQLQAGLSETDPAQSCAQLIRGFRYCLRDVAPILIGSTLMDPAMEALQKKRLRLIRQLSAEESAALMASIGWDREMKEFVNRQQELAKTVHTM